MTTIRLTMAQALIRHLAVQTSEVDGREVPLFAGVFAIFGHGNVAGLGELNGIGRRLPETPTARGKECERVVVSLRLYVLGQGDRHRPAVGRVGQHP